MGPTLTDTTTTAGNWAASFTKFYELHVPFANRRAWGPDPTFPKVLAAHVPPASKPLIVAGPCSIESNWYNDETIRLLKKNGVRWMRGGVYRSGTYGAYGQGFRRDLLAAWARAAHRNGIKIAVEVIDLRFLRVIASHADAFQVGARQMQNYGLLRALARLGKPVFLKRNMGATLHEFLGAAEYLMQGPPKEIILVERGSSTHMNHVRWDLSISLIAAVKKMTQLRIIVDPSHGTGRRDLIEPMTLAGLAAGADGFMLEVHREPERSLSDADQAIDFDEFERLLPKARKLWSMINIDHAKI